jgi:hypothetical protein
MIRVLLFSLGLSTPAYAQTVDEFVRGNLIATFYHELGHALIDILDLPIFGQEEDAADTLSAVMIHQNFAEEEAVALAYHTAYGFLGEVEELAAYGEEIDFAGVHGPDQQRYYNFVCLFYGASPEERDDIADELGLPEERQETCGWALDQLDKDKHDGRLIQPEMARRASAAVFTDKVVRAEVERLNALYALPISITVTVEACDEANAFYDSQYQHILMCQEYAGYLATIIPDAAR